MVLAFPFCDREADLKRLLDDLHDMIETRHARFYLIQGRPGVGKTRLVDELIRRVSEDMSFAASCRGFSPESHVITHDCQPGDAEPYHAFRKIAISIRRGMVKGRIFKGLLGMAFAWAGVGDLVNSLKELGESFKTDEPKEQFRRRAQKVFVQYVRELRSLSKNAPIILHIKNAQWLDQQSLELLEHIVRHPVNGMWVMIFLEEEEVSDPRRTAKERLHGLVRNGKLTRLHLIALHKTAIAEILASVFGQGFFTVQEHEHIYAQCDGLPGELEQHLKEWIARGWLRLEEGHWHKVTRFEEHVLPTLKKLINVIIGVAQDTDIDAGERKMVENIALITNTEPKVIEGMIDVVTGAQALGYKIEKRLHAGAVSDDAFLAYDDQGNQFILEYVAHVGAGIARVAPREVDHKYLLRTLAITPRNDGALLVYEFVGGSTLADVIGRVVEERKSETLRMARQIAEGLRELHRNGYVHGFLHPGTILCDGSGDVLIGGLDICQIASPSAHGSAYERWQAYLAPETRAGAAVDPRSDIYSFGVILYRMLLQDVPGGTATRHAEMLGSAVESPIALDELPDDVRPIVAGCTSADPRGRYATVDELLEDLDKVLSALQRRDAQPRKPTPIEPDGIPERRTFPWRLALALAAAVAVVVTVVWLRLPRPTPLTVKPDTVLVVAFTWEEPVPTDTLLTPAMLHYLVTDDLTQSTGLRVVDEREWQLLRMSSDLVPQYTIGASLGRSGRDYVVRAVYLKAGQPLAPREVTFHDPIALLTERPTKTAEITAPVVETERRTSTFTENWDAFVSFYRGEVAWVILDVTAAEKMYAEALDRDGAFALARLRLAQVRRFNGRTQSAQELVDSLGQAVAQLSETDRLRAAALREGLRGNLMEEVTVLRQVYEKCSTRKEAAYDVAEAYYRICDIGNAIHYYQKALDLDPNFARAHNHLGYCYTHQGRHEEALNHFHTYVRLDGTANAYDSLGDGYMSAGQLDSAAVAKETGISKDPSLNYLYQSLCYINILRGRLQDAAKNAELYLAYAATDGQDADRELQAQSLYLRALIAYYGDNFDEARRLCASARELFDPDDLVTRNHDLHWLEGLVALRLNDVEAAHTTLQGLKALVDRHRITATRYQMNLYKNYRHLEACLAAREGRLRTFEECVREFRSDIKDKVKDHSSTFDLAFFNSSFGELYLDSFKRPDLAVQCLADALAYNPHYAFAHALAWRLYERNGDQAGAAAARATLDSLWSNADPEVRHRYGL